MMVSPTAELMHLTGTSGKAPANLFGVSEDLAYIDTSFSLIPRMVHPQSGKLVVGMIYNQAEPQSVDALNRIKGLASRLNMTVEALPVTNSSEALLVTRALLQRKIDVFFANPDNVVFASFDTIVKSCSDSGVPVFTSEAGLVQRGAVAAFGADIYQWGHQAGIQAARYLKTGSAGNLHIEMVKIRRRMFNSAAAEKFGIARPAGFEELNR
jgi:putative ABC transport system substrate-binding protein